MSGTVQDMENIYREHAQTVYRYLLARTHDAALAEELTQETFYQAVRSAGRITGECKITTWLCGIARNVLRTERRRIPEEALAEPIPAGETADGALLAGEERVELLRQSTARFQNVEVDFSNELLAAYARRRHAHVVVKGLRAVSDFEQEVQMAVINRKLNPRLETMFLASSEKYTYLSSTIVKEMARYGANLADFVPREIVDAVNQRMRELEGTEGKEG